MEVTEKVHAQNGVRYKVILHREGQAVWGHVVILSIDGEELDNENNKEG